MKITPTFLICLLAISGCGGGGGSSSSDNGATVTVSIAPGSTVIPAGQTQTFSAAVSGSSNHAVAWSLQEGAAGGMVTPSGLYTAPNASGTFHLIATSQADATKSATATITCTPTDPSFSSTAPLSASEGTLYSYTLAAADPAGGSVAYTLSSGPAGAALNGNSLTWTPTSSQSRSANQFTIIGKTASNGTATQSWSVTPSGTIRGTAIDNYYTAQAAGVVTQPEDLSAVIIAALVPNGSGGYITYPGTGTLAGTFQIPNVPGGDFYVKEISTIGATTMTSLLEASGSTLDLGRNQLGRPDATPAQPGTTLTFNVTNANTIQTLDQMQYFVPSVHGFTFLAPFIPGTTTLTTTNVRWPGDNGIQSSANGDTGYLVQLVTQSLSGQEFQTLKKTLQTSLTMNSGANTVISGAFSDVPQTASIDVNVRGSSFALYDSAMSPSASSYFGTFLSSANPGGMPAFLNIGPPNLISSVTLHAVDNDFGNVAYGNPYPAGFSTYISFTERAQVLFTAPGATNSASFDAAMMTAAPSDAAQPLLPVISPATNPMINNSSLFVPQTGIGLTPTITWNAPQLGTPDVYNIMIYSVQKLASGSVNIELGLISTNESSVAVPPGILAPGGSYFFVIRAVSQPDRDGASPLRITKPQNYAELVSAMFQP